MKRFLLLALTLGLTACTENTRARQFGGTEVIQLQPGQKVVNVTWKDHDLWILTRPMREDEEAEKLRFAERSSWGVWQGEITVIEAAPVTK